MTLSNVNTSLYRSYLQPCKPREKNSERTYVGLYFKLFIVQCFFFSTRPRVSTIMSKDNDFVGNCLALPPDRAHFSFFCAGAAGAHLSVIMGRFSRGAFVGVLLAHISGRICRGAFVGALLWRRICQWRF